MWAAGIVLYMLLVGDSPFNLDGSTIELFKEIINGENIVEKNLEKNTDISNEA